MNKKILVFLVAETGAGKDTVANKLPYNKVVSYTTRKKRAYEKSGIHHIFISDKEMYRLEKKSDIIAWTNTGGVRYCATVDQLVDPINIYIINPDGVRWFREHYKKDDLHTIVIGLYLPLAVRQSRCRIRDDFETSFMKRVEAEQDDYNKFRLNGEFDYMIKNEYSNKTASVIYGIIQKEMLYNES